MSLTAASMFTFTSKGSGFRQFRVDIPQIPILLV